MKTPSTEKTDYKVIRTHRVGVPYFEVVFDLDKKDRYGEREPHYSENDIPPSGGLYGEGHFDDYFEERESKKGWTEL